MFHFSSIHSLPVIRSTDYWSHTPANKITTVAHPVPHRISRVERMRGGRILSGRVDKSLPTAPGEHVGWLEREKALYEPSQRQIS